MQFGPCSCWCGGVSPSSYYYGSITNPIVVATLGQTLASGKPNVFAFDANGNLLWTYLTGWFVGVNQTNMKVVNGMCRDPSGNIYLSYSTRGKAVVNGYDPNDFAFGIQKLDRNGNLLQDWTPSGWTLCGQLNATAEIVWHTQQASTWYNRTIHLPDALYYDPRTNTIWWQHPAKLVTVGSGTLGQRWDPTSQLDLNFNELASYGGSNYMGTTASQAQSESVLIAQVGSPGRVRTDTDGNPVIEVGRSLAQFPNSTTGATTLPTRVNASTGALLLNAGTLQPLKLGGVATGRNAGLGQQSAEFPIARNGFDVAPDLGTKGYLLFSMMPNFNNDSTAYNTSLNPGNYNDACRTAGGLATDWCHAVNDACGNTMVLTIANLCQHFAACDVTMTNTNSQVPVWNKTYCNWTFGHGDRIAPAQSLNPCGSTSILYVAGRVFFAMGGTDDAGQNRDNRGALTNSPCITGPAPTYNDRANYGVWVLDATTGGQFTLQSNDNINNVPWTSSVNSAAGVQGLSYHKDSGSVVAVGQYNVPLSSSPAVVRLLGPFLFNFTFGIATNWRVDLSSTGALGLNATDVTCVLNDAQ